MDSNINTNEAQQIAEYVKTVQQQQEQINSSWLAIAEVFVTAHNKLRTHAFERFINDVGFTRSVSDKLRQIGNNKALHHNKLSTLVNAVEGWTVLYELSKLTDKQLDGFAEKYTATPEAKLTRQAIHNFITNKPAGHRSIVIASIEIDSESVGRLNATDIEHVIEQIEQLKRLLDSENRGFVLKDREKALQNMRKDVEETGVSQTFSAAA